MFKGPSVAPPTKSSRASTSVSFNHAHLSCPGNLVRILSSTFLFSFAHCCPSLALLVSGYNFNRSLCLQFYVPNLPKEVRSTLLFLLRDLSSVFQNLAYSRAEGVIKPRPRLPRCWLFYGVLSYSLNILIIACAERYV